ncbi:MAG: hypothetical protein JST26_00375 [Bacteroidetes bacterium]|nr:hypothetical protein [Bacteroidota bacterium]
MMSNFQELARLSSAILASENVYTEVETAKALSEFIHSVQSKLTQYVQKDNETKVSGGIALSSYDAALCLDDYIRTARFLKGTHAAIRQMIQSQASSAVNILYAGCGPLGTLLLPLLPLFDSRQLDCVLLDINASSLESVQKLLNALGLQAYSIKTIETDATTYRKPENWPMNLLITETMFRALVREPQVSVTINLAGQLEPNGILIPESINMDMVYTTFGDEPYLRNDLHAFDRGRIEAMTPYPNRQVKNRLFSINKELDFLKQVDQQSGDFRYTVHEMPVSFDLWPDICVFTQIHIYGEQHLESAESYITNPFCITNFYNLAGCKSFELVYHFRDLPNWSHVIKQ